MAVKSILLVEDVHTDAAMNLHAFRRGNLRNRLVWVQTGEDGVDCLTKSPDSFLMVLLDLKLPRMSGLDVLRWIRSAPQTQRLPVIILTGSQDDRDIAASYELGADGFITKPVMFSRFIELATSMGVNLLLEPRDSEKDAKP